jgi:hypothetical protein
LDDIDGLVGVTRWEPVFDSSKWTTELAEDEEEGPEPVLVGITCMLPVYSLAALITIDSWVGPGRLEQHRNKSNQWTCLVLSCLVLSRLVLSCLVLSCLVLSCLVLSCLVLSCLVLSCLVMSCLVVLLSCYPSMPCWLSCCCNIVANDRSRSGLNPASSAAFSCAICCLDLARVPCPRRDGLWDGWGQSIVVHLPSHNETWDNIMRFAPTCTYWATQATGHKQHNISNTTQQDNNKATRQH